MTPNSPQAADVKATLDKLIHGVTSQGFDVLEMTYHDEMRIYMLKGHEVLHQMDKVGFIAHMKQSMDAVDTPSTWAKYHLVEADEKHGHIVISRKVNLTGNEQMVTLSIDFVYEDSRWQITREVIFT
ncbi:hypothetical protein CBF23_003450 [Marinomonas agarivorans]|nr:hypothetical protein CBF23_003450 [Marinomonas agarivorans]